jgi:Flp pilus assembly secretin CpaC
MFKNALQVLACVLLLPLIVRAAPPVQIQLDVVLASVTDDATIKPASQPLAKDRLIPVVGVLKDADELDGYVQHLQGLREKGQCKVLAEPRVVTLSGRPASTLVGGQQAIPVPLGPGQVGIRFVDFGVRVNFLPTVLPSGKLRLEVEPEVSCLRQENSVTINDTVVPSRDTTRVNTSVEMEPGQTFLLGGLRQEKDRQVVLLVTPHLIRGEEAAPEKSAESDEIRRLERQLKKIQKKLDELRGSPPRP